MSITSLGDLASSVQLRRDSGRLKSELTRITNELSSGVTSDVGRKVKGDFGFLASIEQGIARSDGYSAVINERQIILGAQQLSLSKLRQFGQIASDLLALPDSADRTLIANAGSDALNRFSSAVGALNTQVAGRTIFSGVASDQPALADPETILSALESEISLAAASTASDLDAVVSAWFSGGGGFDTVGYVGGVPDMTVLSLSDTETAQPISNAQEQAVRDQLAALALGALLGRNVLSGDLGEQGEIARIAGEKLITSDDGLITLQASIGVAEAQLDRASVEVGSQKEGLQLAKAGLIEVDPYDAAVRLQNAEAQLQSIYAITARLSRLSLVSYL